VVVQLLVSVVYTLVEHSWEVSTVLSAPTAAAIGFASYRSGEASLDSLVETVESYRVYILSVLAAFGGVATALGLNVPTPLVGELISLMVLGAVFWVY
jgi:hypothetical protein